MEREALLKQFVTIQENALEIVETPSSENEHIKKLKKEIKDRLDSLVKVQKDDGVSFMCKYILDYVINDDNKKSYSTLVDMLSSMKMECASIDSPHVDKRLRGHRRFSNDDNGKSVWFADITEHIFSEDLNKGIYRPIVNALIERLPIKKPFGLMDVAVIIRDWYNPIDDHLEAKLFLNSAHKYISYLHANNNIVEFQSNKYKLLTTPEERSGMLVLRWCKINGKLVGDTIDFNEVSNHPIAERMKKTEIADGFSYIVNKGKATQVGLNKIRLNEY